MNNIEHKRIKAELLENQAIEISQQIHTVKNLLENDVNDSMNPSQSSSNAVVAKTDLLKHLIRIFNEFSFIKNVFELECDDLRLEYEWFTLKDSLMYWLNFLLSVKPEANINLNIDPWLPRDVEWDLVKFHQIMISVLDFALKSTNSIDVDLKAMFDKILGGFKVYFEVSFICGFDLKEEDLKAIFETKDEKEIDPAKVNKFLGLPIHMISRILKVIKGDFDKITMDKNKKISIKFHIPFKMADFSSHPYIKIKPLDWLVEFNKYAGTLNYIDIYNMSEKKIVIKNDQESGNEGSNNLSNTFDKLSSTYQRVKAREEVKWAPSEVSKHQQFNTLIFI